MSLLPSTMPETQSIFFMPLLTNAYLIVKGHEITSSVLSQIELIKKLKLLTDVRYTAMLNSVVNYLKSNSSILEQMEKSYNNIDGFGDESSSPPTISSVGHITGQMQEEILKSSVLSDEDYSVHFMDFTSPSGDDTKIVFTIFEAMIICEYSSEMCGFFYNGEYHQKYKKINELTNSRYYLKYLKYKAKYLKLKNKN
jgi:hypothetical protein